jgi:hypothetical protein
MSHEEERVNDARTRNKPERAPPHRLNLFVERSRCAGRTIKGVRERLEFQTPGYDKYPFQSHSLTPKVH